MWAANAATSGYEAPDCGLLSPDLAAGMSSFGWMESRFHEALVFRGSPGKVAVRSSLLCCPGGDLHDLTQPDANLLVNVDVYVLSHFKCDCNSIRDALVKLPAVLLAIDVYA
jgi:hypothetical protein